MHQPHDDVGLTRSGFGLLGIVERDETGVMCHECGRWLGGLSYHLRRKHGLSVAEYREAHQLPARVPLVSLGTSRMVAQQSAERVGSPEWQRFAAARDAALPESRKLATAASAAASVGTKAVRARRASERFTGARPYDEERWDKRLEAYVAHWRATGTPPAQKTADVTERSLGVWMSHQWSTVYAGKLSDRRRAALEAAGIPLDRDRTRGHWWRGGPPT